MFDFNVIKMLFLIFVPAFIVGLPLALAFFKDFKFSLWEKAIFGLIGGTTIPLLMLLLESLIIPLSLPLVIANFVILFVAGIVLCWKWKVIETMPRALPTDWKVVAVPIALVVILFLAFFIRFQTYSATYQELDPYFYAYGSQQILQDGSIPATDNTGWYPLTQLSTHQRGTYILYLSAEWYSLYTGGENIFTNQNDNYLLFAISSLYPPLVALFLCFCLFILIRELFGNFYGLIGSGLACAMPILIVKMFAGVSEVQPFALFGLMFFLMSLVLLIKYKDIKFSILACFCLLILNLGSVSGSVALFLIGGLIVIQTLIFYKANNKEQIEELVKLLGIVLLAVLLTNIFLSLEKGSLKYLIDGNIAIAVLTIAFPTMILGLFKFIKKQQTRHFVLLTIIIIGILALFLIPVLNNLIVGVMKNLVGTASYVVPLSRTIAEQGLASTNFANEFGLLGTPIGDILGLPFLMASGLINVATSLTDTFMLSVFGLVINTSQKEAMPMMLFLLTSFIAAIYYIYKDRNSKEISAFVLLFLLIFTIGYVGLNKPKYATYFSLSLIFAVILTFWALEKGLGKIIEHINTSKIKGRIIVNEKAEKQKLYGTYIIMGMAGMVLLLMFNSFIPDRPTLAQSILSITSERYQDNPALLSSKMAEVCQKTNMTVFCEAKDYRTFTEKPENQFNVDVCAYSLLPNDVIYGKRKASPVEQMNVAYRCSTITDYWISSMEWIRNNTEKDARIMSWWDYGHYINYFGQRDTVLRNEHSSNEMIGEVAFAYTEGNETDLRNVMIKDGSKYAIFDYELIMQGNNQFGGKYGALNYLGCAYINQTNVSNAPSTSACEQKNLWLDLYIPINTTQNDICTISPLENTKGIIAFTIQNIQTPQGIQPARKNVFCVDNTNGIELANGQRTIGVYDLNVKNEYGELKLNRALLQQVGQVNFGTASQPYNTLHLIPFYTYDKLWIVNNTITSGYEDAPMDFYKSNIYKALFLKNLSGFDLVYQNKGVLIYKMRD